MKLVMRTLVLATLSLCSLVHAVEYKDIYFHAKNITGVYKRTSTETENNDIPELWDTFKKEMYCQFPNAENNSIYVIYTDYTGDCRQNNPYTVIIGYETSFLKDLPVNTITVEIPAGHYKTAKASGKFPDAIIALWQDIFNSSYQQIHSINFEIYRGDLDKAPEVEVYLATVEK